jgi:ankyrin repeat protein
MATLNGQFDLALQLVQRGADPNLSASTDGASPLFAVLNTHWAPKSNYPQPRAHDQQSAQYMDVIEALLSAGADPNLRLRTHLWYWEYGLTKIGTDLKGRHAFLARCVRPGRRCDGTSRSSWGGSEHADRLAGRRHA